MDAFKYTHDDESGVGRLVIDRRALGNGDESDILLNGASDPWLCTVTVRLTQDEAIELYEILRAVWAGYVAERDEAKRTLPTDWKLRESMLEARAEEEDFSDFGYPLDPDLARDIERGK